MESVPYDKRSGKIWFNGKTVDWADANIHILNHGLHYASCVFEGERVYEGKIFKLEEHTERLFYSAERMGITVPYTQTEINNACKKIVNIQKVQNGYVRPLIWRGSEMMAISAQKNKIHVALATWEWGSYFDPKLIPGFPSIKFKALKCAGPKNFFDKTSFGSENVSLYA